MSDRRRTDCFCISGPDYDGPHEDCEVHGEWRSVLVAQRDAARDALDRVRALFAGGPDTACRTTWDYVGTGGGPPVKCVQVPMSDLDRALDGPDE